ncbi:MAG: VCBS repeat-containing protein [Planctomycetales bacterium]|nr:VCBS repeat-containing protein [Planctomycetales bacterium]
MLQFKMLKRSLIMLSLVSCFSFANGCHRSDNATSSVSRSIGEQSNGSAVSETPVNFQFTKLADGLMAAPLVERVGPSDAMKFKSLPPEKTGIDFAHNWTPPEGYQLEIYNSLPGGGVCIGDYDGDDLPDVFLSQANVGCKLYRNLGAMKFADVTGDVGIAVSDKARGASFIDVDNDGDLDLYVCNDDLPNQLFVNDGTGRFTDNATKAGVDFCGASVTATCADYDQDGDLDLYLVTNRKEPTHEVAAPTVNADGSFYIAQADREYVDVIVDNDGKPRVIKAAQFDRLYRNRGDGTFEDVSGDAGLVGAYFGLSATWWDYNGDGWIDLYVSNDFYSPDQLYRNNGDGTFTDVAPEMFSHTPWYSMGTDAADINNDGLMDLMGSDMSGTNHYKQKASMGDMGTTGWFLVYPTPRQYMRNALYLNSGTSRFQEIAAMAGVSDTDWTWSLKFGDFDEDGWIDLFVTNGMNRDWTNSDLRNLSNAAETDDEKMKIWLDSAQRRDANLAFRNNRDLTFQTIGNEWGISEERVSYGAAIADLDRDGDLDVVVNNAEEAPSVYQNEAIGSHRTVIRLSGKSNNRFGVGSRIEIETEQGKQIRELTTAQGYMASNEPLVHFGLGSAAVISRLSVRWPNGTLQEFSDVPADQYLVISEQSTATREHVEPVKPTFRAIGALDGYKHEEIRFNDFARQPLLPNQHSQLGPMVACADVDNDGDTDVFVGGASGQPSALMINENGDFVIQKSLTWEADETCEDIGAAFLDADADGDMDLYVVSGGVECEPNDEVLQDRLYLNDGSGQFANKTSEWLPQLRESGSVVRPHDFDGDGDVDLFVGGRIIPGQYPLSPNSFLLRNEGGRFVDVTDELAPELRQVGMVTDACWADANGDATLDLLLAIEWSSPKIFSVADGRLTDATGESLSKLTGWFHSIAAADVDGDGDTDIAVGNWGLNTKYHASVEKPALLYYGDFENEGRMRLVEAEYEDETLFPVRGKSCSTNAMPFLGNKFEKFHDFAVASLEDIYTENRLQTSHRFAATTLASGIFKNDGTGNFDFIPLPTIGQIAPIRGIAIGDFNGDQKLDLFLAENFYGPQPETGRADGGISQILLGNGDCTFHSLPPHESGIVVPGDATGVTQADLDGDGTLELIVPTNDGKIYTFQRN